VFHNIARATFCFTIFTDAEDKDISDWKYMHSTLSINRKPGTPNISQKNLLVCELKWRGRVHIAH
jgi:hypothetical protein